MIPPFKQEPESFRQKFVLAHVAMGYILKKSPIKNVNRTSKKRTIDKSPLMQENGSTTSGGYYYE